MIQQSVLDRVDGERLRRDILATGEFGELHDIDGHGRTAIAGSDANGTAREYFVSRLQDAGLEVTVDSVGNIVGRWVPDGVDPSVPAVAAGSHLDSVTAGGLFDGVLGTYAALEGVRALQAADVPLDRPIEVVSFTEEEGCRFSSGVLGSSVAAGERSIDDALALTDDDGVTLADALESIGFRGEGRVDAGAWDSWLELHVEQSSRLEDAGAPVGIVTDITGTTRCYIEIDGEANHAGTTSMASRTDALAAASELVLELESTTQATVESGSETAVGTVGTFEVDPGCINVVPGTVTLGIDVRDIRYDSIQEIVADVRSTLKRLEAERGVQTSFDRPYDVHPIAMSDQCVETLQSAAEELDLDAMELHSGAGHDTMHVAKATDSAMVFAPSRDGASHSPQEWTEWDDCTTATQLLTEGIRRLASS